MQDIIPSKLCNTFSQGTGHAIMDGSTKIEDMPPEIMQNILCRLPIEDLFQNRFVCKSWLTVTKENRFRIMHYNHSIQNPHPTDVIFSSFHDQLVYFADLKTSFDRPIKLNNIPFDCIFIEVVGSIHGFICFISGSSLNAPYIIFNPVSGDWIELPVPNPKLCMPYAKSSAFGYDSKNKVYKVIRLGADHSSVEDYYSVSVFTLGSKSWRVNGLTMPLCNVESCGIFVNGYIHWWTYGYENNSYSNGIKTFDVEKENFGVLPHPELRRKFAIKRPILQVFDGCLMMVVKSQAERARQAWAMKDYGVKESWVCEFIIPEHPYKSIEKIRPLTVQKNGKVVVLCDLLVLTYDGRTKMYEEHTIDGRKYCLDAYPYAGTIVKLKDVIVFED